MMANTAGSDRTELDFKGLKEPFRVRRLVEDARETESQRVAIEQRLDKLKDRMYTGEITEEQFEQAKAELTREKQELEETGEAESKVDD